MLPFSSNLPEDNSVTRVTKAFMAERTPVYIVGGAVRDHLLGISAIPGWHHDPEARRRPATGDAASSPSRRGAASALDLDLAFHGPVMPVARRVADRLGWAFYALDKERDVARLVGVGADGRRIECDAAALRGDLRADLLARDFTANALALEMSATEPPQLIDVCGGILDVEARRLRRVTSESLRSDPIRLLRAARLASQLGFAIDGRTRAQIVANAAAIVSVSIERVRAELWKLLACSRPDAGLRELDALDLLTHLLPEIKSLQGIAQTSHHHLDAYDHTLLAVQYAAELRDWLQQDGPPPADGTLTQILTPWTDALRAHFAERIAADRDRAGWLVWHALFHDTGKRGSRTDAVETGLATPRDAGHQQMSAQIAARRVAHLRFSRKEIMLAERVAASHGHPRRLFQTLSHSESVISPRAAFRFFRDMDSVAAGYHRKRARLPADARSIYDGLDVTLLAISDNRATALERGEGWAKFLTAMESLLRYAFTRLEGEPTTPLVDGHILMNHLGLRPGPALGALLGALAEAQAAGDLSSREEALAMARELVARREEPGARRA